ncbi:MAG: nuclear transport factor 2 family protein, partial [Candidatus Palauibacterales bacterium]|nr:nuclear transport factor 2 family protein [Candidatus Palauibacterales bacterium]
ASAGDMAWERGSWTYDPDGAGEAGEMTGEYVTVYKKVGDAWKVASDIGVTHEDEDMEESEEAEM